MEGSVRLREGAEHVSRLVTTTAGLRTGPSFSGMANGPSDVAEASRHRQLAALSLEVEGDQVQTVRACVASCWQ